jgi:hypothetical protein
VSLGGVGQDLPHPRLSVYPLAAVCDDLTGLVLGLVCHSGLVFQGVREPSRAWVFVCGLSLICGLLGVCLSLPCIRVGLLAGGGCLCFLAVSKLIRGLTIVSGQKKTPDFSGACLWSRS